MMGVHEVIEPEKGTSLSSLLTVSLLLEIAMVRLLKPTSILSSLSGLIT